MLLVLKKLQHEKQVIIIIIILYVLSPMSAYCKLIQYGTPQTPLPWLRPLRVSSKTQIPKTSDTITQHAKIVTLPVAGCSAPSIFPSVGSLILCVCVCVNNRDIGVVFRSRL